MKHIINGVIRINRATSFSFRIRSKKGLFKKDDKVDFYVYKENELENEPVIHKLIEVKENNEYITIDLTEEDTDIGEIVNEPITYWYELELNKNKLLKGYDKFGPKELFLYPKGVRTNDSRRD